MADEEQKLPDITVNIKGPSDLKLTISFSPSITVRELKTIIKDKSEIEEDRQRLIYSGKVLKDEEKVELYKVQNGHSIHLVKGASKNPSAPGATSNTSSASTSTSNANAASAAAAASERAGVPSNLNAGLPYAGNPLAQLEGMMGHGFGGGTFNPFATMPGAADANLNDPNAMNALLNNPELISQAMSNLTPEMVDQVIAMNPQLAAMGPQVRAMMTSPMMRQMMSNPEMIRQMMQMSAATRGGASPFGGQAAANPFANLAQPQANTTPSQPSNPSTQTTTNTGTANPSSPSANANPLAGLFGGPGGANPFNPFGMDPNAMRQMNEMFGMGGAGMGATPTQPADTRPLEERYQEQLRQLNEMGLVDPQQNIRALSMTGGNVQAAIELIFSGSIPSSS